MTNTEAQQLIIASYRNFENEISSAVSPDTRATVALGLVRETIAALWLSSESLSSESLVPQLSKEERGEATDTIRGILGEK